MRLSQAEREVVRQADAIKRGKRKEAKALRPKTPRAPRITLPKSDKATRGREIDKGYLAFVRRQPCEARHLGNCSGPIEAAHIRYSDFAAGSVNPGMGRKNHDRHCNPLCRHHHQHDQHLGAERFFWERVGKDAYATAAEHYAAYQSGSALRAERGRG